MDWWVGWLGSAVGGGGGGGACHFGGCLGGDLVWWVLCGDGGDGGARR